MNIDLDETERAILVMAMDEALEQAKAEPTQDDGLSIAVRVFQGIKDKLEGRA